MTNSIDEYTHNMEGISNLTPLDVVMQWQRNYEK